MLDQHPDLFAKSEALEKLTAEDLSRFGNEAIALSDEVRIAPNHLSLPLPARVDARSANTAQPVFWRPKRRDGPNMSLFGDEIDLFVGAEFLVHPGVGDHGVWYQRLVSFSTTRRGIQAQLQHHYWARLDTAPVMGLTRDEMERELHLAVYHLRLPADRVDVGSPSDASYTWKQDMGLAQLRSIRSWVLRSLYAQGLQQEIADHAHAPEGTWQAERRACASERLHWIAEPLGEVLQMDRFDPAPSRPEEDDREVKCFQCAI